MTERSVEHAGFTIQRRYGAPPERVFAAWADPASKARWFAGPEDWQAGPHELDFREGGSEVNSGGLEEGPVHRYRAIYWEIVPDERIVFTYELLIDEVRSSVSLVTVEFERDGEGTRLTFTEHGAFFDGLEDPDVRQDGWGPLLDGLAHELNDDHPDAKGPRP
jgi:uncharacterized protein YndB with AHSA1/START domain